jgi:hypothetical protein
LRAIPVILTKPSVELYLPADSPGKDNEANWLPAPKGKFDLVLLIYLPGETPPSILGGTWTPRTVQRVQRILNPSSSTRREATMKAVRNKLGGSESRLKDFAFRRRPVLLCRRAPYQTLLQNFPDTTSRSFTLMRTRCLPSQKIGRCYVAVMQITKRPLQAADNRPVMVP